MPAKPRPILRLAPRYQPLMRMIGLDAEAVFTHPQIIPWRTLPDRDNCVLDADLGDGKKIRLHIKRYQPAKGPRTPGEEEADALQRLQVEEIPTMNLVGWGTLPDRRSFLITEDLAGHKAADKLVEAGTLPFEKLLEPTADLAAKLHRSGLHHRDLYLCHFFAKPQGELDVRLIDAARVARLGGFLMRGRWIVKDLAQFWYSTLSLGVTDEQRRRWLERYAEQRKLTHTNRLQRAIERKVRWIGKHDAKLREKQPTRNISIPSASPTRPHPNPLPEGEGTRGSEAK